MLRFAVGLPSEHKSVRAAYFLCVIKEEKGFRQPKVFGEFTGG